MLGLGTALVALGAALWLWIGRRRDPVAACLLSLAVSAGVVALSGGAGPCQWESAYFCGRVERDPCAPRAATW